MRTLFRLILSAALTAVVRLFSPQPTAAERRPFGEPILPALPAPAPAPSIRRAASPSTKPRKRHVRLSPEQRTLLRTMHANREMYAEQFGHPVTQSFLAQHFDISPGQASRIIAGKR